MPFWRRSLLKLDKLKSQEERFPILSLLRTESYLLKTAPQCSTQTSTSKPKFCPFLFGVRLGLHSPLPNKGVPPLFKESRGKSVSLISVSQISQTCVFNHCFQRDAKFYPPTTFFFSKIYPRTLSFAKCPEPSLVPRSSCVSTLQVRFKGFYLNLFTLPKPSGGILPILDIKLLNKNFFKW